VSKIRGIATLSFGQGLNLLVNFLFLPYMARVLSYEDYGSYGQVLLIVTLIASLLSFGLPQVLYLFMEDKEAPTQSTTNLIATFLLGFLGFLIIFSFAGSVAVWLDNTVLEGLLRIYALSLAFSLPAQMLNSLFIYRQKVRLSMFISVSSNLLKVILVVISIQLYNSLQLVFISILIADLYRFVISFINARHELPFKFSVKNMITQLKIGFPLALSGIIGTGLLYTDGLMVSKMMDVKAYAIYRNGALEVPFLATLYNAVSMIIMPEVVKLYKSNQLKKIISLKFKVILNCMAILYPALIFILFNAREFIVLYLGEKYLGSATIFFIFNFTILLRVNNYGDVLVAAGKTAVISIFYLLAFGLNIILNYYLILELGLAGAAIATVFSLFLIAGLQFNKSLSILKASIKEIISLKMIVFIIGISVGTYLLIHLISYFIDTLLIKVILDLIFYFPIVYFILLKLGILDRNIVLRLSPQAFHSKINRWV
jgi:O-antigen/teichoic acid export membrane protein